MWHGNPHPEDTMADTQQPEILTNSRATAARTCPRLEKLLYRDRWRPVTDADALRLGTLLHQGLEAWWWCYFSAADFLANLPRAEDKLRAILATVAAGAGDALPPGGALADLRHYALRAALLRVDAEPGFTGYERALIEELLRAYDERWRDAPYRTVAVEVQFTGPLINPATGRQSPTWRLQGKLDVVVVDLTDGRLLFVEHKSTSKSIEPGSPYWQRLRMDSQVSTYYDGAAWAGYDVQGCLYDVLAKPRLRPQQATPEDVRAQPDSLTLPKFRACPGCKGKDGPKSAPHLDPGLGRLCGANYTATLPDGRPVEVWGEPGHVLVEPPRYKSHIRTADETPDEYRVRVREALAAHPDAYLVRQPVARLDSALAEYRLDLWQLAARMREDDNAGRYPRNTNACERWGRFCEFFDVCAGTASLDDPTRYKQITDAHPELATTPDEAA